MTDIINKLLAEYPLCNDCLRSGIGLMGAGFGLCVFVTFIGGLGFNCLNSCMRSINYIMRKRRIAKKHRTQIPGG